MILLSCLGFRLTSGKELFIRVSSDRGSTDDLLLLQIFRCVVWQTRDLHLSRGERTGLVVRASDSGSGDPGSILGQVGVLFP